jgi:hypothetical protein
MAGLGSELVAPIDFNTGWTASGAVITVNSATSFTAPGVANYYIAPFTVGRWYAVTINATFTGSTLNLYNGASAINQITPAGLTSGVSQTFYFLAVATQFNIRQSSAGTVTVNSIAVQEVTSIGNATMFQDSAGTTPVTAVEQPVGLMLDKSQGLVLGSELVTNGDFSGGTTGWAAYQGTLAAASNTLTVTATVANDTRITTQIATTAGRWYRITATIVSTSTGSVAIGYNETTGASSFTLATTPATQAAGTSVTFYVLATNVALNLVFRSTVLAIGQTFAISSVSAKQIAGNHAFQATTASRPVLRARYNLLTYSEQFDNAAWTKVLSASVSANTDTAPDGTLTADTFIAGAANSALRQTVTLDATPYTYSVWIKRKTGTGDVQISVTGGSWSTRAVTNEWTRFTITQTPTAGSNFPGIRMVTSGDEVYIWGADLRTGSSAGTYQRIAAATDYATAGFLPYLALDGTDDSFGTNSIDFSATDKMSVCAGVTKLGVGTFGFIAELSATISSNNGAFVLLGPNGTIPDYAFASKGTINSETNIDGYESPITNVVSGLGDISGSTSKLRVNGAQVSQNTASQGTGNYGNYPLYIGRRANSSNPFNGRIYQMIVCGKTLSASELASTEAFVNTKTGAY